jgi:hypothetical protein
VVRSNGERTKDLCVELLRQEGLEPHVLSVQPFSEAVRQCFQIGIESGAEWLLTADADVLTIPGAVEKLLAHTKPDLFHVQGRIRCKLYMGLRDGGHRLYRVDALPEALEHLTDAVRVESNCRNHMVLKGHKHRKVDVVCGLHDYEQWYRDIYRKAAAHRKKHGQWQHHLKWAQSADPDLRVAACGWAGKPLVIDEKGPIEESWRPSF